MNNTILHHIDFRILVILLFAGIILFNFIGLRVSQYQRKKNPENESSGLGPFEGAMLGLLSLLLAFSFNKTASHYYESRNLIVHETNCIGTALLRADLYPDSVRHAFRNDFKDYIAMRLAYYEAGRDEKKIQDVLQKGNIIAEKIWSRAAIISQNDPSATKSMQMIPAINDMIDAVSLREEARIARMPESILYLLFTLCLAGSFIVGYAGKSKKTDWIILLSYSLMTVTTVYLILDLDQPRQGIITTDTTHEGMYVLMNSL